MAGPYNGTLIGSPTFSTSSTLSSSANASAFGQAVVLDGSTQHISLPAPGPLTVGAGANFTLECRIRTTSTSSYIGAVGVTDGTNSIWLGLNAGAAFSTVHGVSDTLSGGSALNDGAWHSIAVVIKSGIDAWLFVDGVFVAGNANPGTLGAINSSAVAYIGSVSTSGNFFPGDIDEVRMSSSARYDATSVSGGTTVYTPATAPFTSDANTIALYHLDGNATDSNAAVTPSLTVTPASTSITTGQTDLITVTTSDGSNPTGVSLAVASGTGSVGALSAFSGGSATATYTPSGVTTATFTASKSGYTSGTSGAVTVTTAGGAGTSPVRVIWDGPSFAMGAVTYDVQRAPDVSGSPGAFSTIATGLSVREYMDNAGGPAGAYWYQIVQHDTATGQAVTTPATRIVGTLVAGHIINGLP